MLLAPLTVSALLAVSHAANRRPAQAR